MALGAMKTGITALWTVLSDNTSMNTARKEGHPSVGAPRKGCCRRSPPRRQAEADCPMPDHQVQPSCPRRSWLHAH